MFKRILVPLDESTRAERAIPVALRLAQATHGVVILLRVVHPMTEVWPVAPSRGSMQDTIDTSVAGARMYLARLTHTISQENVTVEAKIVQGPPAQAILSSITTDQADIVVMCSHGHTGLKRWVMGSVAEKVAHVASVPVLMLREAGSIPTGPHQDASLPLRVLVPLDGSTHAKIALMPAVSLVATLAGPAPKALHLLKVVPPVPDSEKDDPYQVKKRLLYRSTKYLAAVAQLLREQMQRQLAPSLHPTLTWSVATGMDVAEAIVQAAEQGVDVGGIEINGRSDVIAIATHGYSGFYRWTMGSVTERVLHATKLPLFIVRPTPKGSKEQSDWFATTMAALEH